MSNLFERSGQIHNDSDSTIGGLWPNGGLQWNGGRGQWEGPCPFCNPASADGNVILEGDDRFFSKPGMPGGTCRVCNSHGRGPRGNGWYSDYQIAQRFGTALPADYKRSTEAPQQTVEKPLYYHSTKFVEDAHAVVDYTFWETEYRWPAEVVDHFKLGKATVYPRHPDQNIIPFRVQRFGKTPLDDAYYLATRGYHNNQKIKERNGGSSKHFMALIEEDPADTTFVFTEGDTDPLTAWYLGWRNIGTIFGATAWTDDKAQLVLEKGYSKIVILTDSDNAGQTLAQHIIDSFVKRGMSTIEKLEWGDYSGDISSLLETKNRDEARSWITGRLVQPQQRSSQHQQYTAEQNSKQTFIVSLDELRGEGEKSLKHRIQSFIHGYDLLNIAKGKILHLLVPPGGGKTHALVEQAEKMAVEALASKANQKTYLEEQLKKAREEQDELKIDKLQKKLKNFKNTAVAWYGQYKHGWDDLMSIGANPELWYNYEARNPDNCENYARVIELGEKHHDIGYFCKTACPFYQDCKEKGYQHQEEERSEKPITFFRHQHLQNGMEGEYESLAVIDEFAGHILENNAVSFTAEQIYAHKKGWELELISLDMADAITHFAEATRAAMSANLGALQVFPDGSSNPDYIISGAKFLAKLDQHCQAIAKKSLSDLVAEIDSRLLHLAYQPNFSGTKDDVVHLRCLPQFFDVVVRELQDYVNDPYNVYPSCIHCVAGTLEVYAPHRIKSRNRTPMIIADASGIPVLYKAMFNREVVVHAPMIRNPNAHIEVITGNDWTKSSMTKQIGQALKERKMLQEQQQNPIISLEGDELQLDDIPVSTSLYESNMVQHAMAIVKTLAERHDSLLVVTHKDLREVTESLAQGMMAQDQSSYLNKVAWAHYGSVRGTNKYEDYQAVALLGCFRIPYNIVWRRIQMWAWMLGIKEYIAPDTVKVTSQYDTTQFAETEHRSFIHEFGQAYIDMLEKGELQQSAARIRPHSTDKQKFVYCFANRPAMQFINHIQPQADFLKQTEVSGHYDVYEYMRKHYEKTGKFPGYRTVKTEYHIGTDTIKKIRQQIERNASGKS